MGNELTGWEALTVPFAPYEVEFRAGSTYERDGKHYAIALAYVDSRHYQRRMDEAFGPDGWWDEYQITGGEARIVILCGVTAGGGDFAMVTKWDVGEELLFDKFDKPAQNAATTAKAQAFKRACGAHGLGRHLYFGEQTWCEFVQTSKGGFKAWADESKMQQIAERICIGWRRADPAGGEDVASSNDVTLAGTGTVQDDDERDPDYAEGTHVDGAAVDALDGDSREWSVARFHPDGAPVIVDPDGVMYDTTKVMVPAPYWTRSRAKVPPGVDARHTSVWRLANIDGWDGLTALAAMPAKTPEEEAFVRVCGILLDAVTA